MAGARPGEQCWAAMIPGTRSVLHRPVGHSMLTWWAGAEAWSAGWLVAPRVSLTLLGGEGPREEAQGTGMAMCLGAGQPCVWTETGCGWCELSLRPAVDAHWGTISKVNLLGVPGSALLLVPAFCR